MECTRRDSAGSECSFASPTNADDPLFITVDEVSGDDSNGAETIAEQGHTSSQGKKSRPNLYTNCKQTSEFLILVYLVNLTRAGGSNLKSGVFFLLKLLDLRLDP